MESGTSTPTPVDTAGPSTRPTVLEKAGALKHIGVGETVLVRVDADQWRPMIVSQVNPGTLNGTIFCEPEDYTLPLFRNWSQGESRVWGRPERLNPFAYAEALLHGTGIGQWRFR